MAKIYRTTDRIPIKIDDITVVIRPLSVHEKTEIQEAALAGRIKGDIKEATRSVVLALKYAVQDIKGIVDSDGNQYKLQTEGGMLTDECVSDLMNLEMSRKLVMVCSSLANGIKTEFTDERGEAIEGVELIKKEADSKNA